MFRQFSIYNRPGDIYAWNAVDVRASDGSWEYGRVINVLHNGLVVDFDCPGRRAELVDPEAVVVRRSRRPPGHTFSGSAESAQDLDESLFPQGVGQRVEVLGRSSADRPWTWQPGTPFLCQMYWQRYVFVAMEGPEGAGLKRLMRAHPVRLFTPEAAEPAGAAGTLDFVTRARTLPAAYWGGGPVSAARWEAWKEAVQASEHAFWPVCLMGATLVYLQELRGTPLLDQHLEELRMQANSKLQASPCPLLFVSVPASAALADDDGQGSALPCLPAEVQRAVLDMLDSVQRAQCRRVCPLWDALIGTEWRVIWVSFAHQRLVDADGKATTPDEAGWQRSAYLVGMCLWKCLRETTQTIVISNAVQQWQNNGLGDCLDLLDWLLREQEWDDDVRVVMQRFHWELDGPLTDELHAAAAAVERVVWLKGTFSGPVEHFRRVPVPLCYSHVDDEDDDEEELPVHADLSHLLEAYLAEPEGEERARLLQWLRDAAEQPADSADRQRIDKILHYCQEQDPRVLAKYGDVAWTVDALQADQLGKLTKLTLCALQREMRAPSADRPAAGSPAYSYGDSPAYSPSSPPPSP